MRGRSIFILCFVIAFPKVSAPPVFLLLQSECANMALVGPVERQLTDAELQLWEIPDGQEWCFVMRPGCFEPRCVPCGCWATGNHVTSEKHFNRVANVAFWGAEEQSFQNDLACWPRPAAGGDWWCWACWKKATAGHIESDRHRHKLDEINRIRHDHGPTRFGMYFETSVRPWLLRDKNIDERPELPPPPPPAAAPNGPFPPPPAAANGAGNGNAQPDGGQGQDMEDQELGDDVELVSQPDWGGDAPSNGMGPHDVDAQWTVQNSIADDPRAW